MRKAFGISTALGLLLATPAFANGLNVGQTVDTRLISVCQSDMSARDIMLAAKNKGVDAANEMYAAASDCGPRFLSFKVLQVLDTVKTPTGNLAKMLEIENHTRGRFYALVLDYKSD